MRSWIIAARRIRSRCSSILQTEWNSSSGAKARAVRNTHYAIRNPAPRLTPSPRLAIWTAPPGPVELRAALERVKPQTVYLFGVDPGYGSPSAFLGRLAGLVKHALSARAGGARISELAAATAAREATVRAGLAWLAARGSIGLAFGDGDEVRLAPGDGAARPDLAAGDEPPRSPPRRNRRVSRVLCRRRQRSSAPLIPVHPLTHAPTLYQEVPPCVSASWQCRSAR